jgi:hypothetical protein
LIDRQIEFSQEIDDASPTGEFIAGLGRERDLIEHLISGNRRWHILDRDAPFALSQCRELPIRATETAS